eukprot:5287918-Amphidinium_carterae.1
MVVPQRSFKQAQSCSCHRFVSLLLWPMFFIFRLAVLLITCHALQRLGTCWHLYDDAEVSPEQKQPRGTRRQLEDENQELLDIY